MIPVRYSLRSLLVRKTTTLATVLGIALVVFVLAAALMLLTGVDQTLGASGQKDHAIVLRSGSDAELSSAVDTKSLGIVLAAPGIKKDADGRPLGAGEIVVVVLGQRTGAPDQLSNVQVRGVTDKVFALRPAARIVEGRPAKPGTDEAVIGARIRGRFDGLELGREFELKHNRKVQIVGVFEAGGSSFDSEVWADVDTVAQAFGRTGVVSSVTVAMESPSSFDGLANAIEQDKQLGLDVTRETAFFAKQTKYPALFIGIMAWTSTAFFMIAAIIGAFITMNTAVASRTREIGTLLALGFRGGSVLVSFVIESIALALIGAAIGIVCASFMSFAKFSMLNQVTWSEIVFDFKLTPDVVMTAVVIGVVMGFIGGFIPAFKAARIKPVEAMRG
jgi:putative ABC transport system permease protein